MIKAVVSINNWLTSQEKRVSTLASHWHRWGRFGGPGGENGIIIGWDWYYTKENKRKTTSRAKRGKGENFSFRVPSSSSKDDIVMVRMIYFLKKK